MERFLLRLTSQGNRQAYLNTRHIIITKTPAAGKKTLRAMKCPRRALPSGRARARREEPIPNESLAVKSGEPKNLGRPHSNREQLDLTGRYKRAQMRRHPPGFRPLMAGPG